MTTRFTTVEDYIASFPEDVQAVLQQMRRRIHTVAPGTGEKISYQIPSITVNGKSIGFFAAWKNHVGMYPVPTADEALEAQLARYRSAKSTVRFPLAEPIPYDLVERLVQFLVAERGNSS